MIHAKLEKINRVILSIGHGGDKNESFDTGAVNTKGETENEACRKIVALLANLLTFNGINVLLIPDYGLQKTCDYLNQVGNVYTDIAFEMHKDSFPKYDPLSMRRRCGIYYHPQAAGSATIAKAMKDSCIRSGAHPTSWARSDEESNHRRLAFIRQPKMTSYIIEAGFIQDSNDQEENLWYAETFARAICDILEKKFFSPNSQPAV